MPKFGKVKTPLSKKKVPLSPLSTNNNIIDKKNPISAIHKKE